MGVLVKITEAERAELGLRKLPDEVEDLLDRLESPPRLVAHLTLVHDVAVSIVEVLSELSEGGFDQRAVLFGAATHDIGKTLFPGELDGPGHAHEAAGRELLEAEGFAADLARFAETHGDWREGTIEDLLVALADKVWKGKRIAELEERIAAPRRPLDRSSSTAGRAG